MKYVLALLAVLIVAQCASAQNVTVIGPAPQPGDCALFNSSTVIKTGGSPCSFTALNVNSLAFGQSIAFSNTILTPTTTGLNGNFPAITGTDTTHTVIPYNYINVTSDGAAFTSGSGAFGALLYGNINFGSGAKGGRTAIQGNLAQTATTGNNAITAGFQPFYIAGGFSVNAAHNDNGTGTASNTSSGALQGVNGIAALLTGATDFYQVVGAEFDTEVQTGASAFRKEGVLIAQLSSDAVHGTSEGALVIANQSGAVGWNTAIEIGNTVGGALSSTGAIMICGGNCGSITTGIDISTFTISGFAFKSPGFVVNGSGVTTVGNGTDNVNFETLISGATKGVRFTTSASTSNIQGVDNTGLGSFQPLTIGGSTLTFQSNGTTTALVLDASQNVHTVGHIWSGAASTPVLSACGTTPVFTGTPSDTAADITVGTGAPTSCTVTFGTPFVNAPYCSLTPIGAPNAGLAITSRSNTAITFALTGVSNQQVNYICIAQPTG